MRKLFESPAGRAARAALARAPVLPTFLPTQSRDGVPAAAGGKPVRDTRLRPWPWSPDPSLQTWITRVEPALRAVFLSAQEGLPQPRAKALARRFAASCLARHCLFVPHGTDALRIALCATLDHDGLSYGGEVIAPNYSFIASANAALDGGFGVALVDVDRNTLNLDPRRVEEAIVPGKTRAIVAVHLFGMPCDVAALRDVAERHQLVLIEDAAQAHGALHELGPVGGLSEAAGFSFQSSKNMSAGEGGALMLRDDDAFERAYRLHDVGRPSVGSHRWVHESFGTNTRANEYTAALLSTRLDTLEEEQERRAASFATLRALLSEVSCVELVAVPAYVRRHGVHAFAMRYRAEACGGLTSTDFVRAIQAEGVPLAPAYPATIAGQPAMQRVAEKHPQLVRMLSTPVADAAAGNVFLLPQNVFLAGASDMGEIRAAFDKVQRHFSRDAPSFRAPTTTAPSPTSTSTNAPTSSSARGARESRTLRVAIAGAGGQGKLHAQVLARDPRARLVAIADANADRARAVARDHGGRAVATSELLDDVDAVIVATPHIEHRALVLDALARGVHVLCEKPLAASVDDADAMVARAATSASVFSMVFQHRFDPRFVRMHDIVKSGELGALLRCSMEEASWRTQAYYRSSPWRGTWAGEGGGVAVNQAPHVLDRYVALCGAPKQVVAVTRTVLHDIETEDSCSAFLLHDNGAQGHVHIDTNTAPPTSSLAVFLDGGRIELRSDRLLVTKLARGTRDATANTVEEFGSLPGQTFELPINGVDGLDMLALQHRDFFDAILTGTPLRVPGNEGLASVEVANAILWSGHTHAAVPLPMPRAAYAAFVDGQRRQAVAAPRAARSPTG